MMVNVYVSSDCLFQVLLFFSPTHQHHVWILQHLERNLKKKKKSIIFFISYASLSISTFEYLFTETLKVYKVLFLD